MYSADYMSLIHHHSHFLSSSMRSFKCIIIIFEKLKRQNYDWLQNMFYDIIQQAICQSSAYYLIYVVLHSDHNYYLISYSYYSKFQAAFNKTFFRYINLNILKLVNERKEQYMIQGSVSLNKKRRLYRNAFKMHHHLDEWWKNVQRRLAAKEKKLLNELIHQIIEWTNKNRQKYKTDFIS
jgi:hypothetical protein